MTKKSKIIILIAALIIFCLGFLIIQYEIGQRGSSELVKKTENKESASETLEISNYAVEKISDEKAIFKWVTNLETDSQIKYIPYQNNKLMVEEEKIKSYKAMSTTHEMEIDDFEGGVVYHLELSGKAMKGQLVTKEIPDFYTSKDDLPPIIHQVEWAIYPDKDKNAQLVISWLTNELSSSRVYFVKGITQKAEDFTEKTRVDYNLTRKHVVIITEFDPDTVYSFKVESIDFGGNVGLSRVNTILPSIEEYENKINSLRANNMESAEKDASGNNVDETNTWYKNGVMLGTGKGLEWFETKDRYVFVGESKKVMIYAGIHSDQEHEPEKVELLRYDANNNLIASLGGLNNNYVGDEYWRKEVEFNEANLGKIRLKVVIDYRNGTHEESGFIVIEAKKKEDPEKVRKIIIECLKQEDIDGAIKNGGGDFFIDKWKLLNQDEKNILIKIFERAELVESTDKKRYYRYNSLETGRYEEFEMLVDEEGNWILII